MAALVRGKGWRKGEERKEGREGGREVTTENLRHLQLIASPTSNLDTPAQACHFLPLLTPTGTREREIAAMKPQLQHGGLDNEKQAFLWGESGK